ncbi:MAG TPA: alpha/beta fold hydrolase [Gemmatimonadaceae bacterium]|nr:alpha/beta fold hydrolase [Gemmatimonadaceae bacterium]
MRGEFIDLNGERLYYYAAGSRGAGEPIVLVHGFPTSGHLWLDVVAKLPAGHRVIVLDLLGFGRSDTPVNGDYTIGAHGRRLLLLLDALGIDRACLVGHGTGGAIVEWVALNAPDRVTRVTLVGSSSDEGWFARDRRGARALYDLALRLPSWAWLPVVRATIARSYSDPERGKRSADMYLAPFIEGEGPKVLRRHLSDLTRGDIAALRARRGEIRIPILSSPMTPWRFMPEENPSEVAAVINRSLSS